MGGHGAAATGTRAAPDGLTPDRTGPAVAARAGGSDGGTLTVPVPTPVRRPAHQCRNDRPNPAASGIRSPSGGGAASASATGRA
ncbi:hypothetical protein GCM10010221_06520 [Streptomyces parvus]|nr:hypothetical protein GCM10010221_06520 [Streptomyces parvus]